MVTRYCVNQTQDLLLKRHLQKNIFKDDDYVNIVWNLFDVVPDILGGLGKVKNPWPNVDAHSGALLVHYGLKEYSYYTVLFGVSRALGCNGCTYVESSNGLSIRTTKICNYGLGKGISSQILKQNITN